VFFNIPIIRQIIGFLYFTLIPGFVFTKLLKLDDRHWSEILLFSVGLSIIFLILGGLLINEFSFTFGISRPLSLIPLITILNSLVLVGGLLIYSRDKNVSFSKAIPRQFSPFALLLASLPILSVIGAILANTCKNNTLLLTMIAVISLFFIFVVFSKNLLLSKLYPFAILLIALALLYHSSFISNYIVSFGSDVPIEYFVFKITESNAHWSPTFSDLEFGRINAMLSVTVLPAVYSSLLNIDSSWMFKMIYPLIFSFVPLGLYQIWRKHIGEKYAFISTFLFMANETFYTEMLGLNRQMIGDLFLILLLFVILDEKMKQLSKITCFIIFSFGLVTSHYGISVIFLFFISFALISFFVVKKPSDKITLRVVTLFFILMFGWYMFTSKSVVFDSILEYGDYVYRQLGDFWNPRARESEVLRGLGLETPPTIWNAISRAFAYLMQFFIVVGFVGLITKRSKANYEKEYFIFTIEAMAFLVALIVIPGLANTMNMTRFYHILMFFLAPLCVLGADFLVKMIMKRKNKLIVSVLLVNVLVPYFLFQTEFVYEVVGSYSWSISLSGYRMNPLRLYGKKGYLDSYSVYGAQWVSVYVDLENSGLYADGFSRKNVLRMYGAVYQGYVDPLSNVTIVEYGGIVYLSRLNVIDRLIPSNRLWNTTEFAFIFDDLNLAYNNGGTIIYENAS
jgi:uncharacterized membrane protein